MTERELTTELLMESFRFAATEAYNTVDLMREYRRLTGSKLGLTPPRTPIEQMVDKACGYDPSQGTDEEWREFFQFVKESVWKPWIAAVVSEGTT